jgi:hypothetical protein
MTAELDARPLDLVLVPNEAIHARRRPRTIVALWVWEACLALAIAWPFASTVAGLYGGHPAGDAPLWAPGGLDLMNVGVRAAAAAPGLAVHTFVGLTVAAFAGVWSAAAVFVSVAYGTRDLRTPSIRQLLSASLTVFAPSALVVATVALVQLLALVTGAVLGRAVNDALYFRAGEARAEQAEWLVVGLLVLVAGALGVVQEVARASIVRYRLRSGPALVFAVRVLRRSPRLFWSWGWRTSASLVPVAFAGLAATRLGGRAGLALIALTVLHQAAALARAAMRCSWLARAMRAVDAVKPGALERVRS